MGRSPKLTQIKVRTATVSAVNATQFQTAFQRKYKLERGGWSYVDLGDFRIRKQIILCVIMERKRFEILINHLVTSRLFSNVDVYLGSTRGDGSSACQSWRHRTPNSNLGMFAKMDVRRVDNIGHRLSVI